jgi:biopolymer transport protein ExbB
MEFDLVEVFEKMSAFGLLIVGGLLLMGLASVTVVLERVWAFRRNRIRATHLVARIEPLANRGAWLEVCTEARSARHSPFASLVQGVTEAFALAHRSGNVGLVERVRNEMGRRLEVAEADLRRGMGVLASVGSVAPFVGLLGTVVGIINAFEGIAAENASGIGSVAAGIAEALVVTAIGLSVAIPAVLIFNYLNGRVEAAMLALRTSGGEMVDGMIHDPVAIEGREAA